MLQHCQNLTVCLCLFGCQGSRQHWLFLPEVKLLINETSSRSPGRGITPVISSPSPPPSHSLWRWQSPQLPGNTLPVRADFGLTYFVIGPICLCKMIVLTFLSWPLQAAGVTKSVTLVLLVTRIWRAVRPQINVILTDTNCIVIIMTPVTERSRLMNVNIYYKYIYIWYLLLTLKL